MKRKQKMASLPPKVGVTKFFALGAWILFRRTTWGLLMDRMGLMVSKDFGKGAKEGFPISCSYAARCRERGAD